MDYKELVQVLKQTGHSILCIVKPRCGGPWIGQVRLISSEGGGICELRHHGVHGSEKTLRITWDEVAEVVPLDPGSEAALKFQKLVELIEQIHESRKDLRADLGYKV